MAVPGAPSVTGVTPGDGKLTVAFSAPASDGGSAITSYEVEAVAPVNIEVARVHAEQTDSMAVEVARVHAVQKKIMNIELSRVQVADPQVTTVPTSAYAWRNGVKTPAASSVKVRRNGVWVAASPVALNGTGVVVGPGDPPDPVDPGGPTMQLLSGVLHLQETVLQPKPVVGIKFIPGSNSVGLQHLWCCILMRTATNKRKIADTRNRLSGELVQGNAVTINFPEAGRLWQAPRALPVYAGICCVADTMPTVVKAATALGGTANTGLGRPGTFPMFSQAAAITAGTAPSLEIVYAS